MPLGKERKETNAKDLYRRLEQDFIKPGMNDDWARYMVNSSELLCPEFKARSMGLVCDFTDHVSRIFSAVFPSTRTMQYVVDSGAEESMLFVHHPMIWDIRKAPDVFIDMDKDLLNEFRRRKISIYCLHVPLDDYGEFSTSVNLAKALRIKPVRSFAPYYGAMAGVFGETELTTTEDLLTNLSHAIGHEARLYGYGSSESKDKKVAVIAGGGNDAVFLSEIASAGVSVLITGITVKSDYSRTAHELAAAKEINVIGGTHYSTEKFACMSMVSYFSRLGLAAQFVDDEPVLEDM